MKVLTAYRARAEKRRRLAVVAFSLILYSVLTAAMYQVLRTEDRTAPVEVNMGNQPPTRNINTTEGQFWVDGEPFFIKAVGWDPVRPGELPWNREFNAELVEHDFRRIREAGFNTVRTWAPMRPEELALATKYDLKVLQGIWVDPSGDFDDPEFRRQTLAEVTRAVEGSRYSPAILGYLVLNEPRAAAVADAGLDDTRAFLREVVATVRALDPSAPIGYASWPGLEALDDELLDFVAFNLYPHRPRVVMNELGLVAYAKMLHKTVARGRPFIVSEFGLSVSPGRPLRTPGRGGASLQEQGEGLVRLASEFTAAGAAGTAVFQWSDGWWKNDEAPGDEREHDPHDPEEWFGLVEFENLRDRQGTPRPALAEMARYQRAVLLQPHAGPTDRRVPIHLHASEPIELEVRIDGQSSGVVPLRSTCSTCYEGVIDLGPGQGRRDLQFTILDADGEQIRSEHRLLYLGKPRSRALSISPQRLRVKPGEVFSVEVLADGLDMQESGVTVASYSEDEFFENRAYLDPDADGQVEVELSAPSHPTIMTVIAFENDPDLPPAERVATWAVVEVRQ